MLRELHIRNFALIDELTLTFSPGLNILTGESGAGKSIIIDALGFVLGERVNAAEVVRTGADRASVEIVFDLSDVPADVQERIGDLGLEGDSEGDTTLLLAREIAAGSGKSGCRINGRLVPVSLLKEVGDGLVDLHGQHEHQSLLKAERHIDILDEWCGKDVVALRGELSAAFAAFNKAKRDLDELRTDARERARVLDLYRYQVDEIGRAELTAGEEDELLAERTRLANASKLSITTAEAYDYLSGADRNRCALDLLNAALAGVVHAAEFDSTLGTVADALRESVSVAEDAARDLRRYKESIEFNPERLEDIENRLDAIKALKRKYGETIEEILAYHDELGEKLERLENSEAREGELEAAVTTAQADVEQIAERLTERRRAASSVYALRITGELSNLGMANTRFEVSSVPQPITETGAERIEFLISANPGEPLKPLARIASGGEMSRVMLAIKSVLAGRVGMQTMVFDEIDAGIGGLTANVLGEKLAELSTSAQVMCITHLPQIAARAGAHFLIEKRAMAGRTIVGATPLTSELRVDEIVRMMGGERPSDAAVRHAREMLSAGSSGGSFKLRAAPPSDEDSRSETVSAYRKSSPGQ